MPLITQLEISTGEQFPPERERDRTTRMETWARYSDRQFQGFVTRLKEGEENRLQPNIFRFLMEFWQDAIMADAPVIDYDGSDRQNEFVAALRPSIIEAARLVTADLIRYGCGVFLNKKPLAVQMVDPRYWYPVRTAWDTSDGDVDVIAYPYAVGHLTQAAKRSRERSFEPSDQRRPGGLPLSQLGQHGLFPDHIAITAYRPGEARMVLHTLDGMVIGAPIEAPMTMPAGAPAVVAVREGEGFYGVSDFEDAADYVRELHRRETSVSYALDRHTNPHLAVPEGVMQTDAAGRIIVNTDGMAIPVPEGAQPPAYVTWDPSFEAQSAAMDRAFERILHAAKIAPILVDTRSRTTALPSGAALRRLAIPTVNRIRAIREKLTEAIRDVVVGQAALMAATGGEVVSIEREKVRLQWPPELSSGITDEADALAVLTGAGILDRAQAAQVVSNISRSEAEDIAREERQPSNPGAPGPGPQRPVPDGEG